MKKKIQLVKFITNDDGDKVEYPVWHLVQKFGDADRTACGGEVFGYGESSAQFKSKEGTMKQCTCSQCKELVSWYKSL